VTNTPATRVRALGGEAALAWPLFRTLTIRALRQRYKGSVLGVLWTLVTPLIMVGAYWVVFKFLFGSPIPNYALFMFVGMIGWGVIIPRIEMIRWTHQGSLEDHRAALSDDHARTGLS
jgi:ABC-type polysaccharide/polyol phosphate export permease